MDADVSTWTNYPEESWLAGRALLPAEHKPSISLWLLHLTLSGDVRAACCLMRRPFVFAVPSSADDTFDKALDSVIRST